MSRSIYGKTNTLGREYSFGEGGFEEIEAWNCADDCSVRQLDEQSGPNCGAAAPVKGTEKSTPAKNTYRVEGAFHGDKGGASRFFYVAKTSTKERNAGCEDLPDGNDHPTVKPIALMRYLCRLITPPGGTVLDPFAGSGSTGCAAVLEGFRFIGIELEQPHADIAKARIDYWAKNPQDRRVRAVVLAASQSPTADEPEAK